MDVVAKYECVRELKDRLDKLPPESIEYKKIVSDTETFVKHIFDKERANQWSDKINRICWHPLVYSIGGDDSARIRDAWLKGREHFQLVLDSIRNEISYEDVCKDSFSSSLVSIFANRLSELQNNLFSICSQAHYMFISIDNNLKSSNSEDWANAVTSCRRLLSLLADQLYPPTEDKEINGKVRELGPDKYINRLIAYIGDKQNGNTFSKVLMADIVRTSSELDAIYDADCKGAHGNVSLQEAQLYVIRTIMIIGEILLL